MKKKIISSLLLIGIILLADFLVYLLSFRMTERNTLEIIYFILITLLFYIFLQNILYNWLFSLKSGKLRLILFLLFPLLLSMVVADRSLAINRFYIYAKTLQKSTTGNIWEFDDSLSYKGKPGAAGFYTYYIGDSIDGKCPVFFDSLGFRTWNQENELSSDSSDLFLGCSYSFGDFVEAERTFPYLVAKDLGHTYINGAISGYGFGQMWQIAHRLVPERHFRFVFIQFTDWLDDRSMDLNGPTRFGYRPFPYFSDDSGTFRLNLPAYETLMYSGKNWRKTNRTYFEKLHFAVTDGLKIEVHDYYAWQWARLKMKLHIIPEPTNRSRELERWFYHGMIDLCKQNGAVPVLFKVQYPMNKCGNLMEELRSRCTVVNIDSTLKKTATERGLKPGKLFRIHHSVGKDSIQYDAHPNIFAHALYAKTILKAIKKP